MRLLMCGDVMGRSGRDVLNAHLPELRESLKLDFVLVNAENAAGGFGITGEICRALYQLGADAITLGNHAFDQRETASYIEGDAKLIRPANYPPGTPGHGSGLFELADGRKVLVIQVMGRLFMDAIDDPFASLDKKGVGKFVEMATRLGRSARKNLKVGICGEHGGDPSSIDFCHQVGLDYVSASPFRVPVARLAAAQLALLDGAKADKNTTIV